MSRRTLSLLALLSALSLGGYLLTSHLFYRLGFPLDDAWIHQTYARNLASEGVWAFILGEPSGGSTSPLWGALLAIGHVLRLGPYVWTYLSGWASLWGLGLVGAYAFQVLCPDLKHLATWVGALLILEWHLVWAAGSGMETLPFALVATLILTLLLKANRRLSWWLWVGMLIGLSSWLRPDGVTLFGPTVFVVWFSRADWREKTHMTIWLTLGFLVLFGPYLRFNQALAGAWWPNTFFAKQAEYAELRQIPLLFRLLRESLLPLVGVGVILLPGLFIFGIDATRRREWPALAGLMWLAGYLSLYAWRLPVTYQHGRYVIPIMPVFFIWGLVGLAKWTWNADLSSWRGILGRTWLGILIVLLLLFWGLGARAYARDVAIIESEMVTTAHWIAQNTPQDAVIAAHDIGALGYFGDRRLLDLAGLISPDVIPFIRDEALLGDYLDSQGADYLVTFPGWYPTLVGRAPLNFQTGGAFSPSSGGENMAVYKWMIP